MRVDDRTMERSIEPRDAEPILLLASIFHSLSQPVQGLGRTRLRQAQRSRRVALDQSPRGIYLFEFARRHAAHLCPATRQQVDELLRVESMERLPHRGPRGADEFGDPDLVE